MNDQVGEYQALMSKLKYQNIFENMPIGIIYFNTTGAITDSNRQATHIFGRTKEEFLSLNLLKHLTNQQLIQSIRDVLTHGEAAYEGFYQPINGYHASYLHITFQAIYNEVGMIIAGVGLVKDISAEKKAQITLSHYKQILDSTKDMVAYIDTQYRYIATNKAYRIFHQQKEANIIDKKVSDVIGEENFSHIKILLDRALEGESFTTKGSYQHPNSEDTIYEEIFEEANFSPYINESGDITGVVVVIRNITEQELMKQKMHRTAKQTRHYLDIVPIMILALDKGANVIRVNQKACEILGYTQKELLGENWIDTCIPEKLQNEIHLVFSQVLEKSVDYPLEHQNKIVTKDGQERTIAWKNVLIKDDDGNIIEILSAGEDITGE